MAYGNLGCAYRSLGNFCGNRLVGVLHPRQRVSVAGGVFQGHRVPHAAPGDCNYRYPGYTGGGRDGGG